MAREQRVKVAYHEAGHVVMALACGAHIIRVSALADQTWNGHIEWRLDQPEYEKDTYRDDCKFFARRQALVCAAGVAADRIHGSLDAANDGEELTGFTVDEERLSEFLDAVHEAKSNRFYYYADIAMALLHGDAWQYVDMIACRLLAGEILDHDALRKIVPANLQIDKATVLRLEDK